MNHPRCPIVTCGKQIPREEMATHWTTAHRVRREKKIGQLWSILRGNEDRETFRRQGAKPARRTGW